MSGNSWLDIQKSWWAIGALLKIIYRYITIVVGIILLVDTILFARLGDWYWVLFVFNALFLLCFIIRAISDAGNKKAK